MFRVALVLMLAVALVIPVTYGAEGDSRVRIAVTMGSLASIVRDVCGDAADIHVLVPDGADPHSYSLTPDDYGALEEADLLVLADPEEFEIESQVVDAFPDKTEVDLADYISLGARLHPLEGVGDENFHGYWMYPTNAIAIAHAVINILASIDPERDDYYLMRFEYFRQKVFAAWSDMNATADERGVFGAGAVVAVPGAAYVAETLGMRVRGTIMKAPGVFVSGAEMDSLVEMMQRGDVRYVVCPEEMRDTPVGEGAVDLASRGGVPVLYVRAFSGDLGYVSTLYYNLGCSGVEVHAGGGDSSYPWILAFVAASATAILEGAVIVRFRREVLR